MKCMSGIRLVLLGTKPLSGNIKVNENALVMLRNEASQRQH